jgi:hypothetical protein
MKLYRLSDQNWDGILKSNYDLVFFSSGYEKRCTYFPSKINKDKINGLFVLGFEELHMDKQRIDNDEYYWKDWKKKPLIMSSDNEEPIYDIFRELNMQDKQSVRILVDYSSMSRLWYAGIINWARYSKSKNISIDFAYSVGDHQEQKNQMVINDILAIPGCEGQSIPSLKSVAIFGLGFDGLATLCVLDKIEPDISYAFLASPAAFPDYPKKAKEYNNELIRHTVKTLELPLFSVERTFSYLSELVSSYIPNSDITIIPMGPKPHVLASILLAVRFHQISCLRVSGKRDKTEKVGTTGDVVFTTVEFTPD